MAGAPDEAAAPFPTDEKTYTLRDGVARVLSAAFQPTLTSTYLLLGVSFLAAPSPVSALAWFLILALIASGLPYAYLLIQVARGRLSDIQVAIREQRLWPLVVGLLCTSVAFTVALLAGAPTKLAVTILVGLVCGVILTVVTLWWKISLHSATLAGATVVLLWVWSAWGWVGLPLTFAVGWSRVVLRRHTPAQVVGGAAVAAVVSPLVIVVARLVEH
jgi:membrane-associated phospholipid phosphatase